MKNDQFTFPFTSNPPPTGGQLPARRLVNDPSLLDLFRVEVAACGARVEENLTALGEDASQLGRLLAVARDARTIAGGARILGIEPAARLAQAIEDAAGAGGRGAVSVGSATLAAMLDATSLLARIAAACAHLDGWMVQNAATVDAVVTAIAASVGMPPPVAGAKLPTPGPQVSAAAGVPRRARREMTVFLVDDQPMIAEAIRQMLVGEPEMRLHHCIDPAQALAMAAAMQPTVILQDLVMPDVDGLTLVRYFRAHPQIKDVPIIVLSTREEPQTKADSFQQGANDYVVKLPDRLELVARIRHLSKGFLHLLDSREAWAAALASQEQLEIRNRFIRQIFGRYLSDEIVESLLESPGGLDLGGATRRVTIMMTDLRGFTPLCETLEPRQVVTILNNYLAAMTDVIVRHGGTINEFIGDAILAVFGAPVRRDDDARRAVACAVEMQLTMTGVNARNAEFGLPHIEMGIGLNTGEVVVGNIGSDRRAKYGVVGKHVNLSSRIESHTVGGQILAAESTIHDAGQEIQIEGQMEISPKGVAAPMTIYDVRGIGAPFHRYLASGDVEPLVSLPSPVPVLVVLLRGENASGTARPGQLVALSSRVARFFAEQPVAPMENVKIQISDGNRPPVELWGKTIARVADARPNQNTFDVCFTSISDEVREMFESLRKSSALLP